MQGEGFEKQADAEMRRLSEAAAGLVVMAKRLHPYPSRTRKLSSSAPMVIGGCPPVRVGRCQANARNKVSLPYQFIVRKWGTANSAEGMLRTRHQFKTFPS